MAKNFDLYDESFYSLKYLTPNNIKTGAEHMNKDLLLSLVERIEKLNADTEAIAADIKEIYHEAKMQGFDVKAIKKCISLRKKDKDEREEEDEIIKLYRDTLGI